MHRYKELQIWQRAIKFAKPVYKLASELPTEEKFGLTQQIKRAVVSISLNISEGAGRGTNKDFSRFLDIAVGSLYEVESCIYIGLELEYIHNEKAKPIFTESEEILRMIISFQNKYKNLKARCFILYTLYLILFKNYL